MALNPKFSNLSVNTEVVRSSGEVTAQPQAIVGTAHVGNGAAGIAAQGAVTRSAVLRFPVAGAVRISAPVASVTAQAGQTFAGQSVMQHRGMALVGRGGVRESIDQEDELLMLLGEAA